MDNANEDRLPKIDYDKIQGRLVRKYAGIIDHKTTDLNSEDERFKRIWKN